MPKLKHGIQKQRVDLVHQTLSGNSKIFPHKCEGRSDALILENSNFNLIQDYIVRFLHRSLVFLHSHSLLNDSLEVFKKKKQA